MDKTDGSRTAHRGSLITPDELTLKLPLSSAITKNVTLSRKRISEILSGRDPR
ncbi:3-deoxy-7-phosphoheptulonate synthase [Izhakiella capsodis]|uniref:3-deoxy-7-phosphoheptulonate synthase n=1 Tax=Izhakiella capsodis TaxID=1367852 RepID=A0A1I4V152_9GAMM|nr:3-deoxy-7-phosphoheptulonate synthase [Izhakiella capsodis]